MGRQLLKVPAVIATAAVIAACGGPAATPPDPGPASEPPQPPPRTSWALGHRLPTSQNLRIVAQRIGFYDESTGVTLGRTTDGTDVECYVTVSVPGWGGPDNMVGEKIPTRVQGHPGYRSGKGAEGDYLMWRAAGDKWVMTSCQPPGGQRSISLVAAAVRMQKSSIAVPFGLRALPDGWGIASVSDDRNQNTTKVFVGRSPLPARGLPESEIEISYEGGADPLHKPSGRNLTVNGRPALLDETPRSPSLCVLVQGRHVCISSSLDDTGPYPDRSAEVPVLIAIAENLVFAKNLADRSTWLPAERVLG